MACPMRFVLVFLSAVVAAVLAWRSWKKAEGPDDALCAPEERKPAGAQRGGRAGAEDRGAAPGGDRAAPERTGGPPLRARDAGRAHGGACEPSASERGPVSAGGGARCADGGVLVVRPLAWTDVRLALFTLVEFWTGAYLYRTYKESCCVPMTSAPPAPPPAMPTAGIGVC